MHELGEQVGEERHDLGDRSPDVVLGAPVVDPGELLVDPHEPQVAIEEPEPDRGAAVEGVEERLAALRLAPELVAPFDRFAHAPARYFGPSGAANAATTSNLRTIDV